MFSFSHYNRFLGINKFGSLLSRQQLATKLFLSGQIKPLKRKPNPKHISRRKFYSGSNNKQTIHLGNKLIISIVLAYYNDKISEPTKN